MVTTSYLAVGRAGEVACSSWNAVSWDNQLENLIMDWKKMKTGDTDKMNFFLFKKMINLETFLQWKQSVTVILTVAFFDSVAGQEIWNLFSVFYQLVGFSCCM